MEGTGATTGTTRRRFLGYVVAAPTLVTAARLLDVTPAGAAPTQTIPSVGVQPAEFYDLLDFLRDAATATAGPGFVTVVVHEDGTVGFDMHRTEVGQGLTTSVAMIIAEELDLPVDRVHITLRDGSPSLLFNQITGGSNSIFTIYDSVRTAAAIARQRLLDAAAIQLGFLGSRLSIVDGVVRAPDGSSIGFGELARDAASSITEAAEAQPKEGDFAIVGTPQRRVDARAIVTGAQRYTLDLEFPDAKPTMVARPPTILGTPVQVRNEAEVLAVPGVLQLAIIESGVAIRAETFGQCIDALQVIDVEWNDGPAAGMTDVSVQDELAAAELPQLVPDLGVVEGLLADLGLDGVVPATEDYAFTFAFQPNCPLETNPCIADVRAASAEIWAPMKNPIAAQGDIAAALGMSQTAVTTHVVQGGGSFGRDLFWDAPREAALISQAMGVPVRLAWTRTDDFRQGRAHPACRSSIRVLRAGGDIVTFSQNHTSVNTDFGHGLGDALTALAERLPTNLGNVTFSQSVWFLTQYVPYDFGLVNQLLWETLPAPADPVTLPNPGDPTTLVEPETRNDVFRTGSMRNIYSPNVVTARELVIDDVCRQAGRDPLEFRLAALKDARSVAVLEAVAAAGDWGRTMVPGTAQGLGFHSEYKGRAACLVEIDARPETVDRTVAARYAYTGPRVTRAIFAVDVGRCINPLGLEAQMIGGMMDGIANALSFSLHVGGTDREGTPFTGAYAEDSWEHAYYTRQWNVPFDVQVLIIDSSSQPGGAGEFGVAATMAATACAYARATGTLPTAFPINHDHVHSDNLTPQGRIPQSRTDGRAGVAAQEF